MARKSKYATISAADEGIWRAALYMRLSREDGDGGESESISSQRAIIDLYIKSRADVRVCGVYADDGYTGTDFDRPQFKRLLGDVTEGKINCVIVKDLSRFGRNYIETGRYLETVFPLLGVRFIAVNDGVDSVENPSSVNGVMLPFKNIMNDEYCRDVSLKVKSSLTARRKQGKFIGAYAPYGYKKSEEDHNKLVVDAVAAEVVKSIYGMFLAGGSILGITRALNQKGVAPPAEYRRSGQIENAARTALWSDRTVRRILSDRVYVGDLVQKKYEVVSYKIHVIKPVEKERRIVVENTHTPIIVRGQFEKVQGLLGRDTRICKSGRLSVFAGFLKCADCGRAMNRKTVVQGNKEYVYYVCSTFRRLDKSGCSKHAVRSDRLEKAVLAALNGYIRLAVDMDELEKRLRATEDREGQRKREEERLRRLRREGDRLKARARDLYPDYKDGLITLEEYLSLRERIKSEYEKCNEEIIAAAERLESGMPEHENPFITAFKKYGGLTELSREVLSELVESVNVHEGGVVELKVNFRDSLAELAKTHGTAHS